MGKLVDTRHGKTLGSYETPLAAQKALDKSEAKSWLTK